MLHPRFAVRLSLHETVEIVRDATCLKVIEAQSLTAETLRLALYRNKDGPSFPIFVSDSSVIWGEWAPKGHMCGSNGSENFLGRYIRQSPRAAGAMAFGASTLGVQHFAWYHDARMSGMAPALTVTVALCHAIAGALTGPRLVDSTRTSTASRAALVGAATSLLALGLFAFMFTVYLFATEVYPVGTLSYVIFPLLTAVFAFLADGWALLLVSTGVGWTLYRIAIRRGTARRHGS